MESSVKIMEYLKENGNLGLQDNTAFHMQMQALVISIPAAALEKAGPNATRSELNKIATEMVKSYNGLTASQFLQQRHTEIQQENEANGKRVAEENKKIADDKSDAVEKMEDLKATEIKNWLEGKDCNIGVPEEYNLTSRTDDGTIVVLVNNDKRVIQGTLKSDSSNFESFRLYNREREFFEFLPIDAFSTLSSQTFSDVSSTKLFTWMIPKFKEWTKKVLSSPEKDRPDFIAKQIPSILNDPTHIKVEGCNSYEPNPNGPTIAWFVYDKNHGPGLLVYGRINDNRYIDESNINTHDKNFKSSSSKAINQYLLKCDSLDNALKEYERELHWIELYKVKVASDIPILLSQALTSKKTEVDKANKQLAEKAESDTKAKQRLDLN
jgi:hypothetical protein